MRLFPKNIDFFKLFEAQAEGLTKAAKVFRSLEKGSDLQKKARELKKIETKTDDATHEIIKNLNQTFITPIDREDITSLAGHLDDVVDEIEHAVSRLHIYNIKPIPDGIFEYTKLIEKTSNEVAKCVNKMREKNNSQVLKICEEVNVLENKADDLHREILANLFQKTKDPIKIMKLREIYDSLENVTDRCEDVANIVETIIIKNS